MALKLSDMTLAQIGRRKMLVATGARTHRHNHTRVIPRAATRQALQALQADETEPGMWRVRIGDALTASGAAGDEQVLAAARRLLALADQDKAKAFDIVGKPRPPPPWPTGCGSPVRWSCWCG